MTNTSTGRERTTSLSSSNLIDQLEEDVIQEALSAGVDLRAYSRQVEEQLRSSENEAIGDYIAEAEHIAGLHREIIQCDQALEHVERMLAHFEMSLGSISADIRSLQEQSAEITHRLDNRKQVRQALSQFVDDIIIPRHMIQVITKGNVSDRDYIEGLHELHRKLAVIQAHESRDVASTEDVQNVAVSLRNTAVESIREFLLQRIYELRKPLSNFLLPTLKLLEYRFCFEFIRDHEPTVAKQVQDEFVDTLGKMLFTYFKTYIGRVMKLQYPQAASPFDLLGSDDAVRPPSTSSVSYMTNVLSAFTGSKATHSTAHPISSNCATVYSLGTRLNVMTIDVEAPIIVPHLAKEKNTKFHFEALFRSVQFALVEHASHEYLFITDFFMQEGRDAIETFNELLGKTLTFVKTSTETSISTCHDAIALLLCIQLAQKYEMLMQRRQVPTLLVYWDAILAALWSRLDAVLHAHIESVRMADARKLANNIKDARTPHFIVRRYAELTSSLLSIVSNSVTSATVNEQEIVKMSLAKVQALCARAQTELDGLLKRMAACLYAQDKKRHAVFIINNYDLVLNVYLERLAEDAPEVILVRELLSSQTKLYIGELLYPHFGALIAFVNDTEPLIEQAHLETLKQYAKKVPNIVQSFTDNWKQSIEQINAEVMQSFPNFKNGTNILQITLSTLLQHYHRFIKVLDHRVFTATNQHKQQLINVHTIMVELKKYKPAF